MKHTVVFSADMHGNETQYRKLVEFALENSAKSLIIGGDIAPKGCSIEDYISVQREFLSSKLPELLNPLKENMPDCNIYIMMGNDDCLCNIDVLEENNPELFHLIHDRRLKLTDDFDIVGYSYVPISPFGIKDWERFDLSDPGDLSADYLLRILTNYRLDGLRSTKDGWQEFSFSLDFEKQGSIQKDLGGEIFTSKPGKTVYVMHAPPDNTNLDQIIISLDPIVRAHVGSMAIMQFIEEHQPYLTLHGHIHETVDVSGDFKERTGDTLSLSAGNHNIGEDLAVILFDLYDPESAKRKII